MTLIIMLFMTSFDSRDKLPKRPNHYHLVMKITSESGENVQRYHQLKQHCKLFILLIGYSKRGKLVLRQIRVS